MTVRQLLRECDSAELTGWHVFYQVDAEKAEEAREAAKFERSIGTDG